MTTRTHGILRLGLHGLLVVWLAAVAVAPLWHTNHATPPITDGGPGHDHEAGAWMCDATPESVEVAVDCVLCKAQRQLSQYWSRVPGATGDVQAASTSTSFALFVPRAGSHAARAARAPPLC